MNLFESTNRDRPRKQSYRYQGGEGGWDELGVWD